MVSRTKVASYIEARLDVPRPHVDAVCDFIIENITSGLVLEEEEGNDSTGIIFYVREGEQPDFPQRLNACLAQVFDQPPSGIPPLRLRTIQDTDWVEKYKASVKPVVIGEDIYIRPSWHPAVPGRRFDIIIEPKMAFGTGSHETTCSCLLAIRERFRRGGRFLDIGTGSGILSILADKLGASYIKALDCDLVAIDNCRENFDINNVAAKHDIIFGSVEKCDGDSPYDFICANIIKSAILPMIPRLLQLTAPGGWLTLSGLLPEDKQEVSDAMKQQGVDQFVVVPNNEWLTFLIRGV